MGERRRAAPAWAVVVGAAAAAVAGAAGVGVAGAVDVAAGVVEALAAHASKKAVAGCVGAVGHVA